MSNLLEQASLVMIPSGYKEDIVYSVIPTSGAGDLSFTRASNGTRINSEGLVEDVPWNLLEYSNDITNAIWTKISGLGGTSPIVTANYATSPSGLNDATRIQLARTTASASYSVIKQTITILPNTNYTQSVWLKSLSGTPSILIADNGSIYLNLVTLTTDWVRYELPFSNSSNFCNFDFALSEGVAGSSLSADFLVYGAQLNIGSTANPYFPTTDRLNVPRLTYQNGGGGCPSLLLEPQRTNLVTYSEQFDNAAWNKTSYPVTITANQTASPTGYVDADLITPTAALSRHAVGQTTIAATSGVVYTISAFFKKAVSQYVVLTDGGDSDWHIVTADLDSGTITNQTNATGTITSYSNGWYRVTCTFTRVTTSFINLYVGASNVSNATFLPSFNDVTLTTYVWGCQSEASASYATSYIPTLGAAVTRGADAASKTGISSLIGQTEGTLFLDFEYNQPSPDANGRLLQVYGTNDTTDSILPLILGDGAGVNRFQLTTFSASLSSIPIPGSASTVVPFGRQKFAIAYNAGAYTVYRNGSLFASGSGLAPVSLTAMDLGHSSSFARSLANPINQALVFNTRLSNSSLAELTA